MLDIFSLLRNWFDWCFENPDKITPNHTALYVFCIEHCNRLGWKEKFGLPTTMAKDAIGIRNYKTYKKTLDDLVEFGFIKMIEVSKNQYSANIVALVKYTKAHTKALTKASLKHMEKQVQSIDSIDIPNTIIHNTYYNEEDFFIMSENKINGSATYFILKNYMTYIESMIMNFGQQKVPIERFIDNFNLNYPNGSVFSDEKHLRNTIRSSIKVLSATPIEIHKQKYISHIPEEENKW